MQEEEESTEDEDGEEERGPSGVAPARPAQLGRRSLPQPEGPPLSQRENNVQALMANKCVAALCMLGLTSPQPQVPCVPSFLLLLSQNINA